VRDLCAHGACYSWQGTSLEKYIDDDDVLEEMGDTSAWGPTKAPCPPCAFDAGSGGRAQLAMS
jgi:hypothetical protein